MQAGMGITNGLIIGHFFFIFRFTFIFYEKTKKSSTRSYASRCCFVYSLKGETQHICCVSPWRTCSPCEFVHIVLPAAGLEPARCCHRGILSPLRLPIPPCRHDAINQIRVYTWMEVDSNHRSNLQQIYSLSPLATRESAHIQFMQLYL